MNRDDEHLRLLAIFHYIVGGLAALFSFFPLLYSGMGVFFIWAAQHPNPKQTGEPPPEFLGWIFVALGGFFFLLGLVMAICILLAGRALAKRRRYSFAFVIACIECLFMPFGTVLGVFTLIVLSVNRLESSLSPRSLLNRYRLDGGPYVNGSNQGSEQIILKLLCWLALPHKSLHGPGFHSPC